MDGYPAQVMSDWARVRSECTVMEDEAVLVLNKPAAVTVAGERHGTDLVVMAREAGEELFPVHRIDKVTSGAVLFARQLRWHAGLTRQFHQRSVGKAYLVITRGVPAPESGTIDLPLSVGRKNRVRVAAPRASITADPQARRWTVPGPAVFTHTRTYPSVTGFATLWQDGSHALLVAWPLTGRRHQIRVHLAWIGYPVEGDPLFGAGQAGRTLLHSWRLAFRAEWRAGERLEVEAPPGPDFWAPVAGRLPGAGPVALLTAARGLTPEPAE